MITLGLTHLNGLEVCRRIRQVKTTPIIMMTARDSVIDRVSGLDHGADDYIVDYFGAHTFERTDREGNFHYEWYPEE